MHSSLVILCVAALCELAVATSHHLFSGVFDGSSIYSLTFDDTTSNLSLLHNISTNSSGGSSKWIAIDERHDNLYVADGQYYASYSITNDTGLVYKSSVSTAASCDNINYIVASRTAPYTVFGAPFDTGCGGQVISVDNSGALLSVLANVTYSNSSGVHGLAIDSSTKFIYSADDDGNAIWVHSFDQANGTVKEVQYLAAPTDADPRHLVVHPNGQYAYVVFEAGNALAVYTRDDSTGKLTYTNTTYPLIPSSYTNSSSYWADEVAFSNSGSNSPKYLYAATRSMSTSAQVGVCILPRRGHRSYKRATLPYKDYRVRWISECSISSIVQ